MKNSIRLKLFALMSSLIVFFVILSWFLNLVVLEKYYNHVKTNTLFKSYEAVKHIFREEPEEMGLEIEKIENANGLNVIILDKEFNTLYNSRQKEFNLARAEKRGYSPRSRSFDFRNFPESILQTRLSEIDKGIPILELRKDNRLNTNFISLFAKIDEYGYIFMSTPVAAIKESVQIANNFFLITGIVTIILGAIVIFLLSNKLTKPIQVLSDIADRMAHMDFSEKYETNSKDEIGQLGESLNSLSEDLQKSIEELKQANNMLKEDNAKKQLIDEMRREFISSASHELKTPIALISGYAEGLRLNVNKDEESKNYYCEIIIDESYKMNKLVTNLLELSILESGEVPLEYSSFNIKQLTESVLKKNNLLFLEKNIDMDFQFEGDYEVRGDYHKIEQVLNNYVSNALNHVSHKGTIRIQIQKHEKMARIYVFNSGEQIPEEALDKIWSSFYKVDKARTRAYGGTGLGLSVVKTIMASHGSSYGVENHEKGVEFWFELSLNQ